MKRTREDLSALGKVQISSLAWHTRRRLDLLCWESCPTFERKVCSRIWKHMYPKKISMTSDLGSSLYIRKKALWHYGQEWRTQKPHCGHRDRKQHNFCFLPLPDRLRRTEYLNRNIKKRTESTCLSKGFPYVAEKRGSVTFSSEDCWAGRGLTLGIVEYICGSWDGPPDVVVMGVVGGL